MYYSTLLSDKCHKSSNLMTHKLRWVPQFLVDVINVSNYTFCNFTGSFGGRGGRPAPLGRGGIGRNPPNKQKNK